MWLLRVAAWTGAVAPHAPLLVIRDRDQSVTKIRAAIRQLPLQSAEAIVLVSPHGSKTGVYGRVCGSLDAFGATGFSVDAATERSLVESLASAWDRPILDGPVDHGAAVPLMLLPGLKTPVVVCALTEDAKPLADALEALPADRVAVIGSAHTSAALSPRAPLQEKDEGHELDDAILAALNTDVGNLPAIHGDWQAAGSCGSGPLSVLGHLFAGRRASVLAHDAPFGVGYVVASIGP